MTLLSSSCAMNARENASMCDIICLDLLVQPQRRRKIFCSHVSVVVAQLKHEIYWCVVGGS